MVADGAMDTDRCGSDAEPKKTCSNSASWLCWARFRPSPKLVSGATVVFFVRWIICRYPQVVFQASFSSTFGYVFCERL